MKVSIAQEQLERGGLAGEKAFGIVFDAKMAKILSDGLYADKIGSIIREISCNAYDAHVQVGRGNEPFDVHLPNLLEPWFSVQDRGPGLDPQQVRNIYTIYGCSTKTDSNDVIGQLGLGSKSPFSYTDAFTVVSVKHGRRNVYSMFKDESGMPSCAAMGPGEDTAEPTGVRVEIPVSVRDFGEFSTKACSILRWFKTMPHIVGANVTVAAPEVHVQGQGWFLQKNPQRRSYYDPVPIALMGNVAFPIDCKSLTGCSEIQRNMLSTGPVFEFAIGDLEVAASREALGYDTRTIRAILGRCTAMANELAGTIEQQIATCTTLWSAKATRQRLLHEHNLGQALGKYRFTWQGVEFDNSLMSMKVADVYSAEECKHHVAPLRRIGKHNAKSDRYAHGTELRMDCVDDNAVVVIDDGGSGLVSKLINYRNNFKKDAYFIIFRPSQLRTEDEIINMLGTPPCVVRASELPKPPAEKRSGNNTVSKYTRWEHELERGSSVDDAVDLADGGFYIPTDRWNVSSQYPAITYISVGQLLRHAQVLGIIPADTAVYTGKGRSRAVMMANENWINIIEYIAQAVDAIDSVRFAQEHVEHDMVKQITSDRSVPSLYNDTRFLKLDPATSLLGQYFQLLRASTDTYTEQVRMRLSSTEFLYNAFNKSIPSVQTTGSNQASLAAFKTKLCKRYPMIYQLTSAWNIEWRKEHVRNMIFDYVCMVDLVHAQQNNIDEQQAA